MRIWTCLLAVLLALSIGAIALADGFDWGLEATGEDDFDWGLESSSEYGEDAGEEDYAEYAEDEAFAEDYDPSGDELAEILAESPYPGAWTFISWVDMEFCLPEGWDVLEKPEDAEEIEVLRAANLEGTARLTVYGLPDDATDISDWVLRSLPDAEVVQGTMYDIAVEEDGDDVRDYYLINDGWYLVRFHFERDSAEVLRWEFAWDIINTAYDVWLADDDPMFDDESGEYADEELPEGIGW